jgi:uncharacterized membrane protein
MHRTDDLISLSFVRDYPVSITIIDIAWGMSHGIFASFNKYLPYSLFFFL